MNWLLRILLIMFPLVLSAQTPAPTGLISTASITPAEKKLSFRIRWRQSQTVDSTMIYVYLSNSNTPTIIRKAKPSSAIATGLTVEYTDTISFTIPDDTTTYRFQLLNLRRGLVSLPANVNWKFQADNYYQIARLHIKPDSVVVKDTTLGARIVQFCAFLEFNDGSIVMRDRDRNIVQCITEYEKFNATFRKSLGARLRKANQVCLEWKALDGGTIGGETCS